MKKLFAFIWNWVVPIAIGILAYVAITTFWINIVTINGDSMDPNLLDQQKVLVQKTQNVKRGDVVVFDAREEDPRIKTGNKDYVKRVIAVAGDTVSYKNGDLYVNDKKVDESYISSDERNAGTASSFGSSWNLDSLAKTGLWSAEDQKETVVPKDSYFVLGDHRSVSNDSRYFGYIHKKHVIGKIHVPFWYSSTVKNNISKDSDHYFA
ncbi:signal peptidase I [Fructobacillus sp. W13]|uniref:Signal peptidase I n=1 Tax=Fructobacillus apis TaxID=2935017 RepID=A0ABT0ZQX4_9LACO|nr:signal peptidase I [Fructobacillus apis]MCO0832396.1 signal peptidase I [Fructobacillus apis]